MKLNKNQKIYLVLIALILIIGIFWLASKKQAGHLVNLYYGQSSIVITDRNGGILYLKPNEFGYYADYQNDFNDKIKQSFIAKEDKYFYYHPGFNPVSIVRALKDKLFHGKQRGASTITQQLAKIVLANEQDRTLKNKIKEFSYALSLETHLTKDEIINMYLNSIFFGNNTQGIESASRLYFGRSAKDLNEEEIYRLTATVSNPSNLNPFKKTNTNATKVILNKLKINLKNIEEPNLDNIKKKLADFHSHYKKDSYLELVELTNCQKNCRTTVANELNETIRDIVYKNISTLINKNAYNAAVVVIKYPENELLAIVGSPKPDLNSHGYQINMATKPRPIGSTVKPFIYAKAFEKGLRPYTLVDDREYKYTIGSGFAFYPKNYDYEYRGIVDLHYALSNSLNVPTVKVLEYVGLNDFYKFFQNDMEFTPVNNWESYQLGIALGGLDMDLLTLSHYFTIFANSGELKPLTISTGETYKDYANTKKIVAPAFIELVNKILTDRETGTEQFGAKSNLNLLKKNYAVKTGTSREYHDSWTIGYTPDFLVGVWVGNHDDTPMDAISGQSGAGSIWHETMNLLFNSKYNRDTQFDFKLLKEFSNNKNIVYGLPHDNFEKSKYILTQNKLILEPHDGDQYLMQEQIQIPFQASKDVTWYVNNKSVAEGNEYIFKPLKIGSYKIKAENSTESETISIIINED